MKGPKRYPPQKAAQLANMFWSTRIGCLHRDITNIKNRVQVQQEQRMTN